MDRLTTDKSFNKIKTAASFEFNLNSFIPLEKLFSVRRELAFKMLSTPPSFDSKMQKEQLKLFKYYNKQVKAYLGL